MKRVLISIALMVFMIFNSNANHWNPDPYQYESNMTVVGVVMIDGVEQTSEDIELGAFCNGDVRGSVMGQYVPAFNRCIFFMMIYGVSGDSITFALYDHSAAEELNVTSLNVIVFSPNEMLGTVSEPYQFQFEVPTYTVTVDADPDEGGTVVGGGTFNYGTEITVTAEPNENYSFISWKENDSLVCTTPEYSFIVTNDRNLVATFSIDYYTVTAEADPDEGGNISGAGNYESGTVCNLVAHPNTHYFFDNWTIGDSVVSLDQEYTFTVTESVDLTAHFHFFDNLNENGEESVQIYPNPASERLYIIRCNGNEQVASIINMAGETIFTKKITSEFEIIDLSCINKGVYVLAIGNTRSKFVIR